MILGFFLYDYADIFDILVEVLISVLLYLFFKTLNLMLTMESFKICYCDGLPNEKITKEIFDLCQEIKSKPFDKIADYEVRSKRVSFMLLYIEKFTHILCFSKFIDNITIKTREQAKQFAYRHYKILLLYIIVVPFCFLANTLIDSKNETSRVPKVIINVVKGWTTGYCLYHLIFYVKNMEHAMKEYGLLIKFFCIKLIILFVTVQTIVLSFASVETKYHTETEMEHIINFFLLNIENCALAILWVTSFSYGGLSIHKFKDIKFTICTGHSNRNDKSGLNDLPKANESQIKINEGAGTGGMPNIKEKANKKENEKL